MADYLENPGRTTLKAYVDANQSSVNAYIRQFDNKAPPNSDETTAHVPIEANAVCNPIQPAGPSYTDISNAFLSPPTESGANTSTTETHDTADNHNTNIINDSVASSSNVEEENTEKLRFVLTEDEEFKSTIVINEDTPGCFKRFKEFQEESFKIIKKKGLFINRDLFQILSLYNIDDISDRDGLKISLFDLYKKANKQDRRVIDVMVNLLNKLPNEEIKEHDIEEQELIVSYTDPIISSLLHNPGHDKLFIWLNRTILQNYDKRPDAGCVALKGKRLGFAEVKPDYKKKDTVKTHEDLIATRRKI